MASPRTIQIAQEIDNGKHVRAYYYLDHDLDGDERVSALVGGAARFVPHWDPQVMGPALASRATKDYSNPSALNASLSNPGALNLHFCGACEVTWLGEGLVGADRAKVHPAHETQPPGGTTPRRSILVFIDGACPSNGPNATRSSIGVYFGPQSDYNVSRLIKPPRHTNQVAELASAIEAMRIVRTAVLPARRALVRRGGEANQRQRALDLPFRLILATDSSFLVEGMCQHKPTWSLGRDGVYITRAGTAVINSDFFRLLDKEIDLLSGVGIQVVWYYVPRQFNTEADALAKVALLR